MLGDIRRLLLLVVLGLVFSISGCGIVGLSQIANNTDDWEVFDPNDYGITTIENGGKSYKWSTRGNIDEKDNSINYWNSKFGLKGLPAVKGELNGNVYPMIFDTGCTPAFLIQYLHINENKLPVYFLNPKKDKSGIAIAKSIKADSLIYYEPPCFFFSQSPRWTFHGDPFSQTYFFVGLPIIKSFKFCKFDQVENKIQLSPKKDFNPENAEEWVTYPFELKGKYLLMEIPIEGSNTILMLDTGSSYQLKFCNTIVEKLYKKRMDFKKARKSKIKDVLPLMDRKVEAIRFSAMSLTFGNHILKKIAVVDYPPEDNSSYDGVVGMGLFEKTIMVLDFEKNLMWVKIAKGSAF